MFDLLRGILLRVMKVPPEPHPPLGDPASVKIFRAGRNYFRLRMAGWVFGQTLALAGIAFWVVMMIQVDQRVTARRLAPPDPASPAATVPARTGKARLEGLKRATNELAGKEATHRAGLWVSLRAVLVELALVLPPWVLTLLWALKVTGFTIYVIQFFVSYAVRRLDYEMHWYIVTDRSLRLRTGVWRVQELTMSFANLQQVEVSQGPVQRLLGLADVRVQSAGGSSTPGHRNGAGQMPLHTGFFHGVEHADEIRDLILARLRHFRDAGLGDPDDRKPMTTAPVAAVTSSASDLLSAAQELRNEAKRLREVVSR